MDALWKMALFSQNEKAIENSQELLVALHLKFDNQNVNREHKQAVIESFVNRCMSILNKEKSAAGESMITTMEGQDPTNYKDKKAVI